jgi:hypothetical protein
VIEWPGRWAGQTVAILASGPSLTAEDVGAVRAAGLRTIVTNTTFRAAPWADALMGFDSRWWREHIEEVRKSGFAGELLGWPLTLRPLGVLCLQQAGWFRSYGNSGTDAVSLAMTAGARRVLLLGVDCQRTGGQTHHHGDHPKGMSNANSIDRWPKKFEMVAKFAKQQGVEVLNCSRATALRCFPRVDLTEAMR